MIGVVQVCLLIFGVNGLAHSAAATDMSLVFAYGSFGGICLGLWSMINDRRLQTKGESSDHK